MTHNNKRPATFRNLGDGDIGVWIAYEDKDHAKALPAARWDPGLKCWRVPVRFEEDAQRLVDRLNGTIDGPLEDALETMFSRVQTHSMRPRGKRCSESGIQTREATPGSPRR